MHAMEHRYTDTEHHLPHLLSCMTSSLDCYRKQLGIDAVIQLRMIKT